MSTRISPIMTSEEFEAVSLRLGRHDTKIDEVAKAVLVNGTKPLDAAIRFNISWQRVNHIVRRFRAAARDVPPEWRRVEVWLPETLAARVEALAEKARANHVKS